MEIFQSRLKEERPDEAEIKAWAAKIVENNRSKQVTSNTNRVIQNIPGNSGLLRYFPRLNGQALSMPTPDTGKQNSESSSDDGPSLSGRFCWKMVGKTFVPCVMKDDGTKFVAVRIAESKVLSHFLQRLNTEVFNCVSVKSFSITEGETRLLNEINTKHCECAFGKESFTVESDFIVKLQDLEEFYTFMETCFNKLTHTPSNGVNKCGFVRINDDSVVPYAVKNGQQYVPLFYFEGETESLKTKAINLENWDLAYLKFCCKVQGIKNELFASEQCQVTSLEDVKSYFPEGTKFDEYWPTKLLDMQTPTRNDVNGNHSWVQTPQVENTNVPQPTVPNAAHSMANKPLPTLQKQLHNNQRVGTTAVINNVAGNVPQYQNTSWPSTLMGATANNVQSATYQVTPQMASVVQPRLNQKQNSTGNLHTMNANMTSRSYVGQTIRQQHCSPYYSTSTSNVPTVTGAIQQPPTLARGTIANSVPNTYAAASSQNETYNNHQFSGSASLPSLYQMGLSNSTHPMNSVAGAQINKPRNAISSQASQNASRFPPALTPITTPCIPSSNNGVPTNVITSNTRASRTATSNFVVNGGGGGGEIIDLSSPPHSPKNIANSVVGSIRRTQMPNNIAPADYNNRNNSFRNFPPLACLGEVQPPPKGQQLPFKAKNILFKDKQVLVMNLKPYNYDDFVMTLPDVISHFFPRVDMNRIRHVLQNVFKITLYKGNMLQMQVLKENQKCKSIDEDMPLVLLKDLDCYFPQLGYLESTLNSSSDRDNLEREAKRQKVS